MNVSRRYLGDVFTILALTLATGAFQSLIVDASTLKAAAEGNPLMQGITASVYIIITIRALRQYRAIVDVVLANKCLISLVGLAVLSTLWSEDPTLTLRRSAALLGATLFGVDFAVRYSLRSQLRLLAIALGSVVIVSVAVQVFAPDQIPKLDVVYPHAWIGLFGQKNEFGRNVVLVTSVILTIGRRSVGGLLTAILTVLAALGLILAAESTTSLLAFIGMMLLLQFTPTLRWPSRIRAIVQVLSVGIALPTLYLVIQNRHAFLNMLGRNSSLTGRTRIWALSFTCIALRPMLGYGYDAFWFVSSEAVRINAALHWTVPHAHNAYIEVALELGLVGLTLYIAAYAVAMRRAIVLMRADHHPSAKWPLVYLYFVLLYSFTETTVLSPKPFFWILFVAAACSATQPTRVSAVLRDSERETGSGLYFASSQDYV